jgi:hypothetical protein
VNRDGSLWRLCAEPTCGANFIVPHADPDRIYCRRTMGEKGIPALGAPKPVESIPTGPENIKVCVGCDVEFLMREGEEKCPACLAVIDQGALTVLEVDEKPEPIDPRKGPLFRRLSDRDCLEYAAEMAADMESGYYLPLGATAPWPAGKRFIISEILRRMGYGLRYVSNAQRPRWWPEGGTAAFRGYVQWKVETRAMLGKVAYERLVPYLEAATFRGYAELVRRVTMEPEKIPFRDLSQFVLRGADAVRGRGNDPLDGNGMSAQGSITMERITFALKNVGDATARARIMALLESETASDLAGMRETREALPAQSS